MSRTVDIAEQIRLAGLPEPVAEYRFHPSRRFRFDWAWPEHRVALEREGATWTGGRHVSGAGYESDCVKYSEAALLGWVVIRATASMIRDGRALQLLERALKGGETA